MLTRTAADAATIIVRARLDSLSAQCNRLADPGDPDALHDFRVALRRVRSALRAYRPWLGAAAARKLRARLRDLGRQTNHGRDAEVQAAWIEAPGADGNAEKLVRRLRKVATPRLGRVREETMALAERVRERLATVEDAGAPFRTVFASLLQRHLDDVALRLAAIGSEDQVDEVHEARIAAKRLRYLVEPLIDEVAEAAEIVARLERLQDFLGEIHDAHVLEETLSTARGCKGLDAATLDCLRARNAERCHETFSHLGEDGWLDGASGPTLDRIRRLAALAEK